MPTTTTMVAWMQAKATELDQQAQALRTAAEILAGTVDTRKRAALPRTVDLAIALRQAQRNGHGPAANGRAAAKANVAAKLRGSRAAKRDQVLAIVRAYGKPMPIAALRAAARAEGIASLTGIVGYVRQGMLKRTGRKGQTRYQALPATATA